MRILGIDHGRKRIGLALSDPLGLIAHGLPTLTRRDDESAFAAIGKILSEKKVEEIVVGLPKNMNDTIGEEAKMAMAFADRLRQRFALPVHFVDERLTSARAERSLQEANLSRRKRQEKTDRIAAQLILQTFLDQRSREKR